MRKISLLSVLLASIFLIGASRQSVTFKVVAFKNLRTVGQTIALSGETPWDTIERFWNDNGYLFNHGDYAEFRIEYNDGNFFYLYSCVDGEAIDLVMNLTKCNPQKQS